MRKAQKQGTGKDQQLKSILFIYKLLYQNLMVTANQKSTIDTHTKIKKDSKHNTKINHQITKKENKRRGAKRPTKTNPTGERTYK